MSAFIVALVLKTAVAYVALAAFVCLLFAAEMAFPRERLMPMRDRARVISFAAISIPVIYMSSALVGRIYSLFGVRPLFPGAGLLHVAAVLLLGDFLYYWYHRTQHSVGWLWRIHSVHHSVEQMGAGAGYHHLLDAPLRAALVILPTTALLGSNGGAVVSFVVSLHGFYVHSSTRLNFGGFAWAVCDNRVHRVHHSRDPAHFNRNFGVVTLLWDRLFGTAYFPARTEWPAVGLEGQREPRSVREWLHQPRLDDPHVDDVGVEVGVGVGDRLNIHGSG